jgi:small GTP-binding protein
MQIPLFKIIMAGESAVGKTALIQQFCESRFETSQIKPRGIDFQIKQLNLPEGSVKLSIWDMVGLERFSVVRTSFYRGAHSAALVYDVTRPETLENLRKWRDEIISICPDIPLVVVGNKADLREGEEDPKAMEYAMSIRANYVLTSALTGVGINFLFETLARISMRVTGYG